MTSTRRGHYFKTLYEVGSVTALGGGGETVLLRVLKGGEFRCLRAATQGLVCLV